MNRVELYKEREKVNDELKLLRKELKLPKHRQDFERLRKALKDWSGKSLKRHGLLANYLHCLFKDKYLAGMVRQLEETEGTAKYKKSLGGSG